MLCIAFSGFQTENSTLKEIGIDVFDYEQFQYNQFEPEKFEFKQFDTEQFAPQQLEMTFLRRGVIGVNEIGYVF